MATVSTSAVTTPAVSTTGTLKRTVSDKIRNLFPGSSVLLALVASGAVKGSMIKRKKGLIGKKATQTPKFESFTYTPLAITFDVASKTNSTTYVLDDSTGLRTKYTLVNTANNTVCRVSAISTNTLTITSIGGTTFDAAADDVLLALAPAYEENSSSPNILQKDEDNLYNYVQISRFPVAISASAKGNPHYGGDFFGRIKERNVIEGNRKIENNLIWSERASSGDTTSDSTLSDTFRTTRGLWNWAGGSFDCGGSMTPTKFRKNLIVDGMNDVINDNDKYIMFCGREIYGRMTEWVNEDVMITEQGSLKNFGIKSTRFITSGPIIEVITHDSFDRGSNSDKALIFRPEDVFYAYKTGRDLAPSNGIQENSRDGFEDEIIGEVGIGVLDGGEGMTKITDWY